MDKKMERKLTILNAIIKDYILNAEPIGSRTIAKKYDLGVSAATIRNEMSDLEEMGFLVQPHTSAGRIPSEKAYRLYVDHLMKVRKLDDTVEDFVRDNYKQYVEQIEKSIQLTAKLLAQLTSYTSIVRAPEIKKLDYKLVQLLPIQDKRVLMVMITKENIVRNLEVTLSESLSEDELSRLNNILNNIIKNYDINDVNEDLHKDLGDLSIKEHNALQEFIKILQKQTMDIGDYSKVFANGVTNMLEYPEFNDIDKVKQFLEIVQDEKIIVELLRSYSDGENIVIGEENSLSEFKDYSLVTTTYRLNNKGQGTIAVIGPIRMNYEHVASVLSFLSEQLDHQINS